MLQFKSLKFVTELMKPRVLFRHSGRQIVLEKNSSIWLSLVFYGRRNAARPGQNCFSIQTLIIIQLGLHVPTPTLKHVSYAEEDK